MADSENTYQETPTRSILKAFSWRVVATLATIGIVFAFTGKLQLSLKVGIVEVLVKALIYYFHERAWNRIAAGKRVVPASAR
jgi:uncharacterized membrane protein